MQSLHNTNIDRSVSLSRPGASPYLSCMKTSVERPQSEKKKSTFIVAQTRHVHVFVKAEGLRST